MGTEPKPKKKQDTHATRRARGGTRLHKNRTLTIVVPHYDGHLSRVHKSRGKQSQLGICEFVSILLKQNEVNPKHMKMTDYVMEQKIVNEFPNRPIVLKMIEDCNSPGKSGRKHPINMTYWRTQYNGGRLLKGHAKPEVKSKRYNDQGDAISTRAREI